MSPSGHARRRAGRPPDSRQRGTRRVLLAVTLALALVTTSGCSWVSGLFGGKNPDKGVSVSVFSIGVGDCFTAPAKVQAQLSDLNKVPCTVPHQQESYAHLTYTAPAGADPTAFPGDALLTTFANGACAEAFADYVGIVYTDSSLYFTYLLPSARSWQGDDRSVLCFVTTTGKPLTYSVKGSKL